MNRKKKKIAHFHQMELFDALYCSEQHWEDEAPEEQGSPAPLIEQHLYWEAEEELLSLLSKQDSPEIVTAALAAVRRKAVEWILMVQACYDFSALTAVLAVNYLDRFLVRLHPEPDQPWMGQLAAVACLSVAAKVEETDVPLLLDFQVEGTTYVFEAKTIQRMELLVLSTLQWKMNPVTSLSFVDYVTRRLGLKDHLSSEFLRRCENVFLSLLSNSRLLEFPPSVVAAATMLQVIAAVEPRLRPECETLLFDILESDKEKVDACCEFILESESRRRRSRKRNYSGAWEAGSPRGVMECVCFSSDSSNDSWSEVPPSISSSPEPHFKKTRTEPSFL